MFLSLSVSFLLRGLRVACVLRSYLLSNSEEKEKEAAFFLVLSETAVTNAHNIYIQTATYSNNTSAHKQTRARFASVCFNSVTTRRTSTRMVPQSIRSFLIGAILALVLYTLVQHFSQASDDTKKRRKKQVKATGASNEGCKVDAQLQRKPMKGIVPQKIDLFTQQVRAAFPDKAEEEVRRIFPRKFEVHGHVVVVRLNDGTSEAELQLLARFFAASFSPVLVDVVLVDVEGIVGELRRPTLRVLYQADSALTEYATAVRRTARRRWDEGRRGSRVACSVATSAELEALLDRWTASATYTTHVENGVQYSFDVSRVMFCSGNTTERMHFGAVDATGETVVDMFCGIGYFTLPLAMHGKVKAIYALEKNPDSVDFITVNAVLNKVDHLIHPICGDNREVGNIVVGQCDRVLMGYIPSCKAFLPRALSFLKHNEAGRSVGTIHYHLLADKPSAAQEVMQDVTEELGAAVAAAMRIADLRCVKSYAPKRYHYVADLVFS